jgi:hypothetical protein
LMARTLATLAVIIGFFIYIYAANVYVAQTYFNRGKSAGTAVPFTQQIQQITQTITQYMQIAVIIVIAVIAVNMAISRRKDTRSNTIKRCTETSTASRPHWGWEDDDSKRHHQKSRRKRCENNCPRLESGINPTSA